MINPWEVKINKAKREWWTDPSKEHKISDPQKMNTTIHYGSPDKKEKAYQFFNMLPGPTKSAMPKMNLPKPDMNNKIYQDKNRNGIPDSFEKKYNKKIPINKKVNISRFFK